MSDLAYKVGSAMQKPLEWGVEQWTKPAPNTFLERVKIAGRRSLEMLAGFFAVILGSIPYAIGAGVKWLSKPSEDNDANQNHTGETFNQERTPHYTGENNLEEKVNKETIANATPLPQSTLEPTPENISPETDNIKEYPTMFYEELNPDPKFPSEYEDNGTGVLSEFEVNAITTPPPQSTQEPTPENISPKTINLIKILGTFALRYHQKVGNTNIANQINDTVSKINS